MRKFIVAVTIILGMLIASVFMTAAPGQAATGHHHVKASVCKTLLYKDGWRKRQCKRQGWFYSRGHYVETDGRVVYWGQVYGPRGRCYLDFPYGGCSPTGPVIR